jgi:uncharacterized iron-regulated protein
LTHSPWRLGACLATITFTACATAPGGLPAGLQALPTVVLLGEVHDNARQHALRLRAFEGLLATGARPALAMEQFDRDRQPQIDRLLAATPRPDADALIAAASGRNPWDWRFYRPFVALALQHGLPIIAANVSRDEARQVMRQGLAATGFDASVPDTMLQAHARGIEDSHCGAIDAATARRMALAQVARDQFMARVVESQAPRGVVLLAGNGHVRTDIGVPFWLSPATRARGIAVGLLEDGDSAANYDRVVFTAPQPRPDPCAAMSPRPAASAPAR